MKRQLRNKIFAGCEQTDFIGRAAELERLLEHATTRKSALTLLAAPLAGCSELLRQTFDRLFVEQTNLIPFYFEFKLTDVNAQAAAVRFLREFLVQTVSFRRRDPGILDASPEICEIAELAAPEDGYWIDRLIESCHSDSRLNNENALIRNCLSAPLRARVNGAESVVMLDAFDIALQLDGGKNLFDDIKDIATRADIPFVIAGKRRPLHGHLSFASMRIEELAFDAALELIENLATKTGVAINDQTRDLIAVQTGAIAGYIVSLFRAAKDKGINLVKFEHVERVYTDEIFGGQIAKMLDESFKLSFRDAAMRRKIFRLLSETAAAENSTLPIDYWEKQFEQAKDSLDTLLKFLHDNELVNVSSGVVGISSARIVRDYIDSRARMEVYKQPRAFAIGEALATNIKLAPTLMARHYRRNAALGLRELLGTLNGQRVAIFLIDYSIFKKSFKGTEDDEILKSANEAVDKIALPTIVFSAYASAVYPRLDHICEQERAAIAIGVSEEENIVVLAAEIDSKIEATAEQVNFWCERLEAVAAELEFRNYRIWLIAPEGFDDGALSLLTERGYYGSSRKQIELLANVLNTQITPQSKQDDREYSITFPMGEDTEMIAAHTIEEIARRHNVPQKTINQIKTALVEAYINATEHSLSPDRKIHQKVKVDKEKITITISNRGIRLADTAEVAEPKYSQRRGWGLKLIRQLMDDIRIDETDDGTSITLVKFISQSN